MGVSELCLLYIGRFRFGFPGLWGGCFMVFGYEFTCFIWPCELLFWVSLYNVCHFVCWIWFGWVLVFCRVGWFGILFVCCVCLCCMVLGSLLGILAGYARYF